MVKGGKFFRSEDSNTAQTFAQNPPKNVWNPLIFPTIIHHVHSYKSQKKKNGTPVRKWRRATELTLHTFFILQHSTEYSDTTNWKWDYPFSSKDVVKEIPLCIAVSLQQKFDEGLITNFNMFPRLLRSSPNSPSFTEQMRRRDNKRPLSQ